MNKTQIEWVKNPDGTQGYTWNPITGCLNHTPEGLCLGGGFPCYAYRLAHRRLRDRYLANKNIVPDKVRIMAGEFNDPFYPRFWPERLDDIKREPLPWFHQNKDLRKGIFVCDMGELFGNWIPQRWQDKIFDVIKLHSQHRFYLLTKQPQNLIKFSPFPDNCFVGVSATNQQQFDNAVKYLKEVKATVKFISFEPLLESIDIDL